MKAVEVLVGLDAVAAEGRTFSGAEGVEISVPLNLLFLSPFNVRKVRNALSIPELAEQIDAETLLNRLGVVAEEGTSRYGVIAGGRRLAALQLLAEQGRIALDFPVPCKAFDSARAVGVSLTENVGQEAMHPADMTEAFKTMVDEGKSVPQIAAQFGVSVLTVERRLKIANLAPMFMALWREGKIEPKQMQALALTNDHDKQIAAWNSLSPYQRSAYMLTQALTEEEMQVTSTLARFVGIDAYEQAGGAVRRDLFGGEDDVYLQDAQLVQSLATAKLEQAAEAFRAAGWKWAEAAQDFSHSEQGRFARIYAKPAGASDDEAEAMKELDEDLAEMRAKLQALEYSDEETDENYELIDRLETEISNLEELREAMDEALSAWTPEQLATAGVVVTIGYNGELRVVEGLVRPEDRKIAQAEAGEAIEAPRTAAKAKADFSERLMFSLTAHRTGAVAAALTDNPHVATVALLHTLILAQGVDHRWIESPVKISLRSSESRVRELATSFDETPAASTLESVRDRWGSKLPADPASLFRYLMAQDVGTLADLLAFYVAQSIDMTRSREETRRGFNLSDAIVDALDLDMADWWTASPAHYLENVPKAKMIEAVTEACGEAESRDLAKMKKAEAIAAAAAKLDGKRWLPAPLRRFPVLDTEAGAVDPMDDDETDDEHTED